VPGIHLRHDDGPRRRDAGDVAAVPHPARTTRRCRSDTAPAAFGAAVLASAIVLVILNLIVLGVVRGTKSQQTLAMSPFGPNFPWDVRRGRRQAAGQEIAARERPGRSGTSRWRRRRRWRSPTPRRPPGTRRRAVAGVGGRANCAAARGQHSIRRDADQRCRQSGPARAAAGRRPTPAQKPPASTDSGAGPTTARRATARSSPK
jgi:hypothetical protein